MKKWAFITGATSDLGTALSFALLNQGYHLLLTAPQQQKLEIFQGRAEILAADLTQRTDRKKILEWITPYKPELLINNAGAGLYGPVLSFSTDEQLHLLSLNAEATLELSLEGARLMKRPGIILNISSAAAFMPYPYFSVYSASKRFLLDFSRAFDAEIQHEGIRVLCACPGQIDTSFRLKASKGRFAEKTCLILPLDKVVQSLLKQIKKKDPLKVIDWRYQWLIILQKWLPTPLRNRFLIRTMAKRIRGLG